MDIQGGKYDVFTDIKVLSSIKNNASLTSIFGNIPSINNSKDSVGFMVDLLGVIVGQEKLKSLVVTLLNKFATTIESSLKDALKGELLQANGGNALPSVLTSGIDVPVKHIDSENKYVVNPSSAEGHYIYGTVGSSFDLTARATLENGTAGAYNGITLNKLNFGSDFQVVCAASSGNDLITQQIDSSHLILKDVFVSETMDLLFNNLTSKFGKTKDEIINKNRTNLILGKFTDENTEDNPFNTTAQEASDLEKQAENLQNGIREINLVCGVYQSQLDYTGFTTNVNNIINAVNDDNTSQALDSMLANSIQGFDNNRDAIKDGFLKKLIDAIKLTILRAIFCNPQIRLLFIISDTIKTGVYNPNNSGTDFLHNNKDLIKCLTKKIIKLLTDFILNILKREIKKIVSNVIQVIAKEKLNNYIGTIKSLTGL